MRSEKTSLNLQGLQYSSIDLNDDPVAQNAALNATKCSILIIVFICNIIAGIIGVIAYISLLNMMNASHIALMSQMKAHVSTQESQIDNFIYQIQSNYRNSTSKIDMSQNMYEDKLQPIHEQLETLPVLISVALNYIQSTVTEKLGVVYNVTSELTKSNFELTLAMESHRYDHLMLQKATQSNLAMFNSTIQATNFHLLQYVAFTNHTIHTVMDSIVARELAEKNYLITAWNKWWHYFADTKAVVEKAQKEANIRIAAIKAQKYPPAMKFQKILEADFKEVSEIDKGTNEVQFAILNKAAEMLIPEAEGYIADCVFKAILIPFKTQL